MSLITLDDEPLPKTMRAVVLENPLHLKYTEIPVWPIETYNDPDLILIKVKACGVCGSDFRYYRGENPWAQHTVGKHVDNPPNIVLGHEYAGVVIAVLSEKNRKWLGTEVVPICSKVCGKCAMCVTNRAHLCENTIHMGHGQGWGEKPYYPGAYAEYAPAWAEGCYEIPPNVSFEEAAMMDVLAVSTHAFHRTDHQRELPILILGAGPIGNGIGQVARTCGVEEKKIIIMENSEIAVRVAEKVGFQNVINSMQKDVAELFKEILQITGNKRIISIFDSIGTDLSFDLGMKLLNKGGTYVNLAVHDQIMKNLNQMQLSSERIITTSSNFSISAYERAWKWLGDGKFTLDPWFTEISLKDAPKIFEEKNKNKSENRNYFKLVILPDES